MDNEFLKVWSLSKNFPFFSCWNSSKIPCMTEWLNDQMTGWQEASQTIDRIVYFNKGQGLQSLRNEPDRKFWKFQNFPLLDPKTHFFGCKRQQMDIELQCHLISIKNKPLGGKIEEKWPIYSDFSWKNVKNPCFFIFAKIKAFFGQISMRFPYPGNISMILSAYNEKNAQNLGASFEI